MASGGRGVGRLAGKVWLVDGAVAGDRVVAVVRRERPSYVEGVAVRIDSPSRDRREPACPIQNRCGGCPWMVLGETAQREWKRRIVTDCLDRIGRFREPGVGEVLSAGRPLGYRNKIELVFGGAGDERVLGYHAGAATGGIVDVERCLLVDGEGNALLRAAREHFLAGPGRSDPFLDGLRGPVRLALRRSLSSRRSLVVLRGGEGPFPSAQDFARRIVERHADVGGVVRISAPPGRRGGSRATVLVGEGWIEEALGGTAFRVPAGAFFQINTAAAEHLVRLVLEGAGSREGEALDLFSGVGVFALALARAGWRVTAVEADPDAVACGRLAAAERGLARNLTFVASGVAAHLASPVARRASPRLVVLDPPRSGLGRDMARRIGSLGAARLVLVSCDPATLARDARALAAFGYGLRSVTPVDLFPQTAHVEVVAVMERAGPDGS